MSVRVSRRLQRVASAKLVLAVKSAERAGKRRVVRLAQREQKVAKQMKKLHSKIVQSPKKLPQAAIRKASTTKITKSEQTKVQGVAKTVTHLNDASRIFYERAKLLDDPSISPNVKIQLLSDMEKALQNQESLLRRLGKALTDPSTIIRLSLIILGGYSPVIIRELGNSAEKSLGAGTKTLNAASSLASIIACAQATYFLGPKGAVGCAILGIANYFVAR
jgi:hypothetical protein